jgi:DNA-binding response OmpR family regulator
MIVEDEKDLCFLLSFVLKQKNLNPSCSNTIADAKRTMDNIKPAVLFLDNSLPDGFGIDFISEIKHNSPATKIVMITAHNSSQEINCALKRGADYFISKPFSSEIIKNTIDLLIPQF